MRFQNHRKQNCQILMDNTMTHALLCVAVSKTIAAVDNMELIEFNIQHEPVSIHQPLPRLLAGGY